MADARRTTRIQTTISIIDELRKRNMTSSDMCEFMQFSPSGMRKYSGAMMRAGVIRMAYRTESHGNLLGKPVYALAEDKNVIDSFIAEISMKKSIKLIGKKKIKIEMSNSVSRFHIMSDDAHYTIRPDRTPASRDPLVAALFGPASGVQA